MKPLEQSFQTELLAKMARAAQLGISSPRMEKNLVERGAVAMAREYFRRGRVSDTFDRLRAAGQLGLSVEALACQGKYGALFEDEEVDFCLNVLMDSGYYQL